MKSDTEDVSHCLMVVAKHIRRVLLRLTAET